MSAPSTRESLIRDLRDIANHPAWRQFADLYRPVVAGFACFHGKLQPSDAEDVAQEVLLDVARAIRKFQYRGKGSFRAWLFTITRHRVADHYKRVGRNPQDVSRSSAVHMLEDIPAAPEDALGFDSRYHKLLIESALTSVCSQHNLQRNSIAAFRGVYIDDQAPEGVARELGVTINAVNVAGSKIKKLIEAELNRCSADLILLLRSRQ